MRDKKKRPLEDFLGGFPCRPSYPVLHVPQLIEAKNFVIREVTLLAGFWLRSVVQISEKLDKDTFSELARIRRVKLQMVNLVVTAYDAESFADLLEIPKRIDELAPQTDHHLWSHISRAGEKTIESIREVFLSNIYASFDSYKSADSMPETLKSIIESLETKHGITL